MEEYNPNLISQEELQEVINNVASILHNNWAKGRPEPKGEMVNAVPRKPRLKDPANDKMADWLINNDEEYGAPLMTLEDKYYLDKEGNIIPEYNKTKIGKDNYDFNGAQLRVVAKGPKAGLCYAIIIVDGVKHVAIDIANTPYHLLSEKWQKDNYEAAKFACELVNGHTKQEIMDNRDYFGDLVHKNWAERNSWDSLAEVDWKDLPKYDKEGETPQQEKDLEQLYLAADEIQKQLDKSLCQ